MLMMTDVITPPHFSSILLTPPHSSSLLLKNPGRTVPTILLTNAYKNCGNALKTIEINCFAMSGGLFVYIAALYII
jgi:hypothetical protein